MQHHRCSVLSLKTVKKTIKNIIKKGSGYTHLGGAYPHPIYTARIHVYGPYRILPKLNGPYTSIRSYTCKPHTTVYLYTVVYITIHTTVYLNTGRIINTSTFIRPYGHIFQISPSFFL